jgi:hypothetical protein
LETGHSHYRKAEDRRFGRARRVMWKAETLRW